MQLVAILCHTVQVSLTSSVTALDSTVVQQSIVKTHNNYLYYYVMHNFFVGANAAETDYAV